ncbi:MAG: hypothetical protein HOK97_06675 [Deltaproteobacteria bacterium]|nr:hypothetical protein [Deltaproteobacteria bacterium]
MMKIMNWTVLLAMCVVFFAAPLAGAAGTVKEYKNGDSASYWSIDTRFGVIFDGSIREIQCQECKQGYYGGGVLVGVDATYNWSEFQAGLSGTFGEVLFEGQRYNLGAMLGWRHDLADWLQFKTVGEVGVHALNNFIDDGMFQSVADNSDFAILPFIGARVGLDARVWPAAGLVLGVWGSGQVDLAKRQYNASLSGLFDSVNHETYEVGGHRLSVGVNLGFEF